MCKSINCKQCQNYWPHNSISFMQNYCYNMKREFHPANDVNDNLTKIRKHEHRTQIAKHRN